MNKKNKLKALRLASQLNNLLEEGVTRIQCDKVCKVFMDGGFSEETCNQIMRLWEDSISLYRLDFDAEEQLKVICEILERVEWPKK